MDYPSDESEGAYLPKGKSNDNVRKQRPELIQPFQ